MGSDPSARMVGRRRARLLAERTPGNGVIIFESRSGCVWSDGDQLCYQLSEDHGRMMMRFLNEGETPESPIQQLLTSALGKPYLWVRWQTKQEADETARRKFERKPHARNL